MPEKSVLYNHHRRFSRAARCKSGPGKIFGLEHNQDTVAMEPGQRFVMRLFATFCGNQHWRLSLPPGLKVVDSWYVPARLDRPLAGGMCMWSIRVLCDGEHNLQAILPCPNTLTPTGELKFHLRIVAE